MILIAGDSWGCSEWPKPQQEMPYPRHGCLVDYFNHVGMPVINLSVGGCSNMEIAAILENFMNNNHILSQQVNRILVFQTGWSRDYQKKHTLNIDWNTELMSPYDTIVSRFISRFYKKLEHVAHRHCKQIELIGGSSDTLPQAAVAQEYSSLRVTCQSMVNLIVNGCHTLDQPVHNAWPSTTVNMELLELIKKNIDTDNLKKLLQDIQLGQQRLQTISTFGGDKYHLTHLEYKILFDFLQQ
jgi:hypothetical protein